MTPKEKRINIDLATRIDKNAAKQTEQALNDLIKKAETNPIKVKMDLDLSGITTKLEGIRKEATITSSALTSSEKDLIKFNNELRKSGSQIEFGDTIQKNIFNVIKMLDLMTTAFKNVGGEMQVVTRVSGFNTFLSMLAGAAPSTEAFGKALNNISKSGGIVNVLFQINEQLAKISENLNIKNLEPLDTIQRKLAEQQDLFESSGQALANYRKSLLNTFGGDAEKEVEKLKNQVKELSGYFNSITGTKYAKRALEGNLGTDIPVKFAKELSAAFALPDEQLEKITFKIKDTTHSLKELKDVGAIESLNQSINAGLAEFDEVNAKLDETRIKLADAKAIGDKEAINAYIPLIGQLATQLGELTKTGDKDPLIKLRNAIGGEFISATNSAKNALESLQAKEEEVIEYNNRGFNLSGSSVKQLADEIKGAVDKINVTSQGGTFDLTGEQVEKVTGAFEKLFEVVQKIYLLLNRGGNLELITKGLAVLNAQTSSIESSAQKAGVAIEQITNKEATEASGINEVTKAETGLVQVTKELGDVAQKAFSTDVGSSVFLNGVREFLTSLLSAKGNIGEVSSSLSVFLNSLAKVEGASSSFDKVQNELRETQNEFKNANDLAEYWIRVEQRTVNGVSSTIALDDFANAQVSSDSFGSYIDKVTVSYDKLKSTVISVVQDIIKYQNELNNTIAQGQVNTDLEQLLERKKEELTKLSIIIASYMASPDTKFSSQQLQLLLEEVSTKKEELELELGSIQAKKDNVEAEREKAKAVKETAKAIEEQVKFEEQIQKLQRRLDNAREIVNQNNLGNKKLSSQGTQQTLNYRLSDMQTQISSASKKDDISGLIELMSELEKGIRGVAQEAQKTATAQEKAAQKGKEAYDSQLRTIEELKNRISSTSDYGRTYRNPENLDIVRNTIVDADKGITRFQQLQNLENTLKSVGPRNYYMPQYQEQIDEISASINAQIKVLETWDAAIAENIEWEKRQEAQNNKDDIAFKNLVLARSTYVEKLKATLKEIEDTPGLSKFASEAQKLKTEFSKVDNSTGLSSLSKRFQLLTEQIKNAKKGIESFEKATDLSGIDRVFKEIEGKGLAKYVQTDFSKLRSEYLSLQDELKGISDISQLTPEQTARIDRLALAVNNLRENAKDTAIEMRQMTSSVDIDSLINRMNNFLRTNKKLSKDTKQNIQSLIDTLKSTGELPKSDFSRISKEFANIQRNAKAAGETGKSFFQIWKGGMTNLVRYLGTFASFYRIIGYIRSAISTVKELDYALVDLRKTTSMTATELQDFYLSASNTAKQLGVTTKEIIDQAAAWSRLGYSSKEASTEMAALSSQFAQISPGMSVDKATDGLVSTMKAFHVEVGNVEREVMDNVNRVGNTMATTNEEVVDMLTRSSAAMSAANNSIKETIALESAAVQITRNAETTGTAFRTISMRIRGLDEETEEALEDFDMLQGKIADLTKTASTPGGISLFTDETKQTYKSTYQLLKEISEIWDELTDKAQAQLLETLAGKRGGQVLAGILGEENFKEVERALQNMEEAAGSADAEMSIVEESISYKLNALKETWVGTLQALVDRGEIGKAVDFLTQISTALGAIISQLGAFGTVIAGSGIVGLIAGIKDFKSIKSAVENIGQIQKAFEGMSDVLGAGAFDGMLTFEDKLPKLVESLGGLDTAQKMAAVSALDLNAEQASLLLIESGVDAETVQQAIDTEVLSVAENKATASTGLLSAALRKLWASYAPFIVAGGIIAGFAAIAAVIYKTKQANDELKKSAKELGDLYSSTKKDISSYKDEVSKLQEILNDDSSSYEESKAARERLLAIQDELIEKYGDEREAVNNITEAVQGNIEAFDKLEAQRRVATLNKFNSQNVEGIDWINRLLHSGTGPLGSASNQLEVMVDEMEQVDRQVRFTADDYDLLVQAAEKFSNLYLLGEGGADSRIDIGADSAKELYEELLQLQEFLSSRGASSKLLNDLAKQADDLNNTINQYEDIYNMYILQNRILDRGNYEKHYTDLINEYDKYTEARNKKDEESAEEYKKEIIQTFSDLQEYLDNDSTLEPFEKEGILNFFKNLYPELQSEVSSWQLTVQIQADIETGEPKGETGSIVDKILNFDNEEQLVHQVYASGSELEDIYQDIERYAEDHGVTVQELIDKYRELGLLKDFAYANTNAIAQKYFESNGQNFNSRLIEVVESGLNSLSQEDYNTSLLFSDKQWNAVAKELENVAGTTDLAIVGAENYAKAVSKVAEEYRIAQEEASKLPTEEKTVAEALKGLKFKDKDDKDITGEEYLDQYYSKMKSIQEAIQGLQNGTLSGQEKTALMQEYNLMSDDVDSMIAELQEFAEAEVNAVVEVIDGLIADNPEDFKLVHALEIIKGYIRDAKDEALGLKSAIGEGATSVNDIQNLKSGMDMIGKIYTDVKDKASFDWSSIINNVEFENTFKSCGEAYDDFIQIIKDSPDDINATQKAFDRLVTQFQRVNSSLYGLKQEDANAAEQMLTDQGVTNAKDLVSWEFGSQEIEEQTKALWENLEARKAVELAKASEIQDDYAREKTIEGINQRYDSEIQHLYDECDALQAATADQKAYYAAKLLANNEGDFTSMSIQQLEAIVRALGMGIDAWKAYYRATKDLEAMNNGTYAYKSQWEWQNKDTLYQMTSNNASAYMNGLADEISKIGKVGGGAVYGGLKDTAGGAGKDAGKSFVDGFDEELSKLKDSYERGEITLAQYLAAYRALIDKYFDDTEKNAEARAKALHDYLVEMKGYYDSAISGVTTLIDYRIKAIQKQKDAAIKAIEQERDAALKAIDDQISAIDKQVKAKQKQIKQLEKEKKELDKRKKVYQDEISAIQKANEERDRQNDLMEKQYNLQKLMNQRTQLVNCIANLHRNVMIIKVAISVKVLWEG